MQRRYIVNPSRIPPGRQGPIMVGPGLSGLGSTATIAGGILLLGLIWVGVGTAWEVLDRRDEWQR